LNIEIILMSGEEMPEIQNWSWAYETPARAGD
jgi:hypothetical protein